MFFNIYNPFAMLCKSTTFVMPNYTCRNFRLNGFLYPVIMFRCGISLATGILAAVFLSYNLKRQTKMKKTTSIRLALVHFHAWLKSENTFCSAICEERVSNLQTLGVAAACGALCALPLLGGIPSILLLLTSSKILNK